MYHPLTMHIEQSLGNTFKLSGTISSAMGGVSHCGNKILQAQTDSHPYVL